MCCFQCSILRQVRVWREVDHRVCTRYAMGTSSTTSLLLEVNLWNLKLPLIHSSVLFLISLIASGQSRCDTVPRKPNELYFLPENFGASDLLQPVSPEKLDEARMKYKTTDSKNDF